MKFKGRNVTQCNKKKKKLPAYKAPAGGGEPHCSHYTVLA